MDRRALIAIVLSFLVLFGSNLLFQKLGWIPSPQQQKPVNEAKVEHPSAAPGASTIGQATPTKTSVPETQSKGTWSGGADTVLTVEQPRYTARFRSRGGRLLSVVLKDYKDGNSGRATLAADPLVALDLGDDQTPASL